MFMQTPVHLNLKMSQFHKVKMHRSGHSLVLTVPPNSFTGSNRQYTPYISREGTIVFMPIKHQNGNHRKDR